MLNALYDPQIVQSYHNEYLKLINFYMNTKRPSSFVRYYNIDIGASVYDDKLEATYDLYHVSSLNLMYMILLLLIIWHRLLMLLQAFKIYAASQWMQHPLLLFIR